MMSISASAGTLDQRRAALMPTLMAGLLGIFIIGFVGFSHMEIVHNAGHDYRHSMAFPCH